MISVEEAKDLVVKNTFQLRAEKQNIEQALHAVLAKPISSPVSYPPFDQSAMDGFALRFEDLRSSAPLEIIGESAAGTPFSGTIKSGHAVRIFTGASVPDGADVVVMQEKAVVEKGKLTIQDNALEKGANIRSKGSQIKKGDVVLRKDQRINPGAVGLLASLGITEVEIYSTPRVALVVTGNELVKPGESLKPGQLYESNSSCLKAALEEARCHSVEIIFVSDDEKATEEILKSAIERSDLVLATGGISVGEYDFVGKAFETLGIQRMFYKVAQKPGKPLFFGKYNSCLIFGLPGNPAAALTCFYEYVLMCIRIMQGRTDFSLEKRALPIRAATSKKEGLSLFLKGKEAEGRAEVLPGQESGNISPFSTANCLIYLPAQKGSVSEGESVEIHMLP